MLLQEKVTGNKLKNIIANDTKITAEVISASTDENTATSIITDTLNNHIQSVSVFNNTMTGSIGKMGRNFSSKSPPQLSKQAIPLIHTSVRKRQGQRA